MTPSPTKESESVNKFVDEIIDNTIKELTACKNFEANFFKKDLCKNCQLNKKHHK